MASTHFNQQVLNDNDISNRNNTIVIIVATKKTSNDVVHVYYLQDTFQVTSLADSKLIISNDGVTIPDQKKYNFIVWAKLFYYIL